MSYKHVGTAADLVRFRCSLKVECTACGAAPTMTGIEVHRVHGSASLERLRPVSNAAAAASRSHA